MVGHDVSQHRRDHDDMRLQLLSRMATTRLAVEAAKARGRMYLACPRLDAGPVAVIIEMVSLLEAAPEPDYGGNTRTGDKAMARKYARTLRQRR